jgi:ubiquinone/menaquinone biosynthesis C-methylase UbiE
VDAFDRRASSYDEGRLGQWHLLVAQRTADVALRETPTPRHILDIGCGTGMLLRELADRVSETAQLAGVDPAPGMVSRSRASLESDPRIVIEQGAAEQLPFGDGVFDLVVSTMSFDHWTDQSRGLCECKRVLQDGGRLVMADLFAAWLRPTVKQGRRERARTIQQATQMLEAAGLRDLRWHRIYDLGPFPLVRAVIGRG